MNTLLLTLALNYDEEMAHQESIFQLANGSADRLVPIWWVDVERQIEELQIGRHSIGSDKIQEPLRH